MNKRKILFVTIVPPFPDDQGNRVVTRNYLDFFIEQGYLIDLIMHCGYDEKHFNEHYGPNVNVYRVSSPKRSEAQISFEEYKKNVREKLRLDYLENNNLSEEDKVIARDLFCAANHSNPFSYLSNDAIEQAETLIQENEYDFVVCNYIYSLRVAKELKKKYRLPKVIVITHDALSRLDLQALEYKIETNGRACSKETEAYCLNYADYICCISKYEHQYFKDMGLRGKCILVEYDAYEHLEKEIIHQNNFAKKRICFFASGNPLNEAGIKGFLENCWPEIKSRVPNAHLCIIGNICGKISTCPDDVELLGRLDENRLIFEMANSTISINPVFLGTGLKIKSVDMMCMGLPFVSFGCGIEGMEDLEYWCYLKAETWQDFSEKVIQLLGDEQIWNDIRVKGKLAAKQRFSKAEVYKNLLEEMKSEHV